MKIAPACPAIHQEGDPCFDALKELVTDLGSQEGRQNAEEQQYAKLLEACADLADRAATLTTEVRDRCWAGTGKGDLDTSLDDIMECIGRIKASVHIT
jgi:hypothetical protein